MVGVSYRTQEAGHGTIHTNTPPRSKHRLGRPQRVKTVKNPMLAVQAQHRNQVLQDRLRDMLRQDVRAVVCRGDLAQADASL